MALVLSKETKTFDTDSIKRGDFIRLTYDKDKKGTNGIVAKVTPDTITVFWLPGTSNVTNYINIGIDTVDMWDSIIWSEDMETIKSFEGENDDGTG